jgi:hypothetical protein
MKPSTSLAVALALAGIGNAALAQGTLVVSPAASVVQAGDVFVVDIRGSGFTGAIVGGGFDLAFNPAVLSLNSVVVDPVEWELLSNPGSTDNVAGTLSAVWFNAFASPLPTGDFPVARLSFSALAPGFSGLNLAASASYPFVNDAVDVVAVSFGSGSVTVSAVPELPAWASLGLGLSALPWLRRRLAVA